MTARTIEYSDSKRHRLTMSTRATGLTRIGRVDFDKDSASFFRFAVQLRKETRPRGVYNAFGKTMSMDHAVDVQVFYRNEAVGIDDLSTLLMGEILSFKSDALMHPCSVEEVLLFGQISGDQGVHHINKDEQGRLLVQGLLTATLPTKIGGDLNYSAREMLFEFLRPVFTGDTIRCEVTITSLEHMEERIKMSASWVCRNQNGKEVLTGRTSGIIRDNAQGR